MAGLSLSIDVQSLDHSAEFERLVNDAQEVGVREAMQEFQQAALDRIATQDIPGPPLSKQTVAIKMRAGLSREQAEKKWLFEDKAIRDSDIHTGQQTRGARADLSPPSDRPRSIYELLEFGGINETGNLVPPRSLLGTVARLDVGRIVARYRSGFNSVLR